jgi:hypothetical protein
MGKRVRSLYVAPDSTLLESAREAQNGVPRSGFGDCRNPDGGEHGQAGDEDWGTVAEGADVKGRA